MRPIVQVLVYSPNAGHCAAFARETKRPGLEVIAADDPKVVVAGADLVCCATSAMTPVFDGEWLRPGQFVVTIANSDVTNKRSEVDRRTFERSSSIIINDWESVVENQQTELIEPIEQGAVQRDCVHELGDVLTGKASLDVEGRPAHNSGIVCYKNNSGLAIQFAAAGAVLYKKAMAEGACKSIPTEWLGSDLSAYYAAGFRPSP